MPVYEYRCLDCNRRFSYLKGVVADAPALECPRCHGANLKRLMSRFARVRSEDEMLDSLDPTNFGDVEDPANMKRWARTLGKEMGEELGDDFESELDEMIEAEARGESLEGDEGAGDMGGEGAMPGEMPAAAPAMGADDL